MAVDGTTFVILLQPSFYIFKSLKIFLKLFLCKSVWIFIMSHSKKKEVILIQFIKSHLTLWGRSRYNNVKGYSCRSVRNGGISAGYTTLDTGGCNLIKGNRNRVASDRTTSD